MNLRVKAAQDTKRLNVRDWGLLVELIDPDGNKYNTDAETGEPLRAVQILYDTASIIPETGSDMVVFVETVVLSTLSLARVPVAGEDWIIRIQKSPTDETMVNYVISPTRAPEGGGSLELIRLYLQAAQQV